MDERNHSHMSKYFMTSYLVSPSPKPNTRWGFSLIEIIIGIFMFTVVVLSIFGYYKKVLESGFLLEEGVEAVRLLRDGGWTANIAALTNGTTYYLSWNGTNWVTTLTPLQVEGIFTRTVTFSAVNRESAAGPTQDNIVLSGGVLDPGTRKVNIAVSWMPIGSAALSTETVETYITNMFSN
jgi:hypothetical protein